MSDKKKVKYINKTVKVAGKDITLFSIDGITWSSRKAELIEIQERQERDKVSFANLKEEEGGKPGAAGAPVAKAKPRAPIAVADSDADEESTYEDVAEVVPEIDEVDDLPIADVDVDIDDADIEIDEDEEVAPKKGRGRPAPVVAAPVAASSPARAAKAAPKAQKVSKISKPTSKGKAATKVKVPTATPKRRADGGKPKAAAAKQGKSKGKRKAA